MMTAAALSAQWIWHIRKTTDFCSFGANSVVFLCFAYKGFDATFYPPDIETVPRRYAIIKANEYMIRHCDYLIAYDKRLVGKTRDFVDLARRLEAKGLLRVENLADALRE